MNTLLILILSLSLATSAASKHDAGIRLVRPAAPVYVDAVEEQEPEQVPEVEVIVTPDPAASLPDWFFVGDGETIGEKCEMFTGKECATNMRPHTHGE